MDVTFTIPLPMPLVSENSRMHWTRKYEARRAIQEWVYMLALQERKRLGLPEATERRAIQFTLLRGPRQGPLDTSNVASALKDVLDSLTSPGPKRTLRSGWLRDDSPRWCDFHQPKQAIDRVNGPAVVVHIWWPVEDMAWQTT